MTYPFVRQYDSMDCGPACICMIAQWYGKYLSLETVRKKSFLTREGVSFLGLKSAAESIGFKTMGVKIPFSRLSEGAPLPCIVHWQQNHFIVVNKISGGKVWISDPALGRMKITEDEFLKGWSSDTRDEKSSGMALFLTPGERFQELKEDLKPGKGFSFLRPYLRQHRKTILLLLLGLIAGSLIQLVLPFMTQAIIDRGIENKDMRLIYLILLGQMALVVGRMMVEFTRGWLILKMGTKLNISIVSDFLARLMGLPIAYFDTKLDGDILQRIEDNKRIENYLTSSSLNIFFSFFSFIIFGIVLGFYSIPVLLVFLGGTTLYILYASIFMPSRERLDFIRFRKMAETNNKMIHIINGMQDIKLAGNEESNRDEWERMQTDLYDTKARGLKLLQYQTAGSTLIHESVNIVITIMAASLVINGSMTLGMMLAVQFIIGQLNAPVAQLVNFMRVTQDARISMERLAEVHAMEPEIKSDDNNTTDMPAAGDLCIKNISFRYEGPGSPWVIHNLNLTLRNGKVTAIVGESGSGKTTLLKLLMGFYNCEDGEICVNGTDIRNIDKKSMRKSVGVVMQDGYVFPDTIIANIAPGEYEPDRERIKYAIGVSNLKPLIESLPHGLRTKIGAGGHGLSQGQKQRILIARVVYKNPSILLLDEATSSLDASNEKLIVNRLTEFFVGKTVVIVAHRLSTVRYADAIAVLNKGSVEETGTHEELVKRQGAYLKLVKDQLELGQ